MPDFKINDRVIGGNSPIFLIAEVGVNHNGDLLIAKKLIDVAIESKVDAIKFQTFITENLLLSTTPKAKYQENNTEKDENFYEMVKKYELSKQEFSNLKEYCSEKGIIFLSTPFDEMSVEWLEELDVPAYKVGSGDMNNFPLLELICSKKKPILLSTGMATLDEVRDSVEFIRTNGIDDIVLFQCTTNYPTSYEEINLNVIDTFKKEFPDVTIGFSDHSIGNEAAIGAASKGVKVIEKHFTVDKEMTGPDHKASLSPDELHEWVKAIRNLESALGDGIKKPTKTEIEIAKVARKSIVSIKNIERGNLITKDDIAIKRPGMGLEPKHLKMVLGKKANKDIPKDSLINLEDID